MEAVAQKEAQMLRGGEWIIKHATALDVFIPELWNEEQRNIAKMIDDFLVSEVHPHVEAMDSMKHPEILPGLLKKAGELGLLGVSISAELGGLGLDSTTAMLTTERIGAGHSFSVGMAAHTGIGTLPILYFGTEAQKAKYIPKLATGEWMACYCLTEPDSGSDALGAKSKAVLNAEGTHYIINGQKMWITNAGFADVFIVFAKIDGDKFTGFIVEKGTPGLTLGEEEKKMGIKGSSTRQVFFQDMPVPVENVLGEIGKGHVIAFNILNIGRIKLGAAALGACKAVITQTIRYANERKQFGKAISNFGAIQHKIAEQVIRSWVLESSVYRATEYLRLKEEQLHAEGQDSNDALLGAAREYAVECAILKVFGSEVLDYVVDEAVQTYGGPGFSEDFPVARAYRDSRINRIFEGTNEINRMLSLNDLFKKAMKGELDLMGPGMAIQKELMSVPDFPTPDDTNPLWAQEQAVKSFKKACLMTAGQAAMKFMAKLEEQQEILLNLADMLIQTFTAESAVLRAQRLRLERGDAAAEQALAMAQVWVNDAADRINTAGKTVINAMSSGDEQRVMLMGLKRFTKVPAINTIALRKKVAHHHLEANQFVDVI